MANATLARPGPALAPRLVERLRRVPLLPAVAAGVACVRVLPILAVLILGSWRPPKALPLDDAGFTLENYGELLGDPFIWRLFGNTLIYALTSLAIGLAIAIFLIWLVERTDIPFKALIHTLVFLPIVQPPAIAAFGWVLMLSPRSGTVNVALRGLLGTDSTEGPLNIFTFPGMVFLTAIGVVPSIFIMLSATFRNMDSRLEEAGRTAGASPGGVLRQITLPVLLPGVLGAAIYYLILLIELFEIPLVIGFNANFLVISTYIYRLVFSESGSPSYALAGTLGTLALLVGICLSYAYGWLTRAAYKYVVISGKRSTYRPVRLGAWKYAGLGFISLFLFVSVVMPIGSLVWSSLFRTYTPPSLEALPRASLAVYQLVLSDPRWSLAIRNTAILVLSAATGTVVLATLSSWLVVRNKGAWARWLDTILFLPRAIPGVVIAFAVFVTFIVTPLYATIWLIVIGHVVNFLPFAVRSMHSTMLQVDRELEEAARASGAGTLATATSVLFPLLRPALVNAWLWVAAHSIRDFTFPLMLAASGNVVVAQFIWQVWERGNLERAAALSVMLMAVVVALVIPARYLTTRRAEL
ncbi:MAG: iron ABC transporter permease [Chloroflexi bacterium]|nr:iron ABC transporter permease [Chloroflexota bacterium]